MKYKIYVREHPRKKLYFAWACDEGGDYLFTRVSSSKDSAVSLVKKGIDFLEEVRVNSVEMIEYDV